LLGWRASSQWQAGLRMGLMIVDCRLLKRSENPDSAGMIDAPVKLSAKAVLTG